MHDLIHTATFELASALAKHLPALLRILDRNWYELSQALALPREGRDWIRELRSVRNRWAHLSASPVSPEEIYRDADTLARVLDMLRATPDSVSAVEAVRRDALTDLAVSSNIAPNAMVDLADTAGQTPVSGTSEMLATAPQVAAGLFKTGNLVGLRSDPDTVVPIIAVMPGDAETRYQVFQNGRQATLMMLMMKNDCAGFNRTACACKVGSLQVRCLARRREAALRHYDLNQDRIMKDKIPNGRISA